MQRQTHREQTVTDEDGSKLSQSKKHQRLWATYQKLGEHHGTDSPSKASEETNAVGTLFWDSVVSRTERKQISV